MWDHHQPASVTTPSSADAAPTSGGEALPADSPSTRSACRLLVLIATALTVARLFQAEPLQSANDRSRWSTVRALVEQGTYRIDDVREIPGWDTIDLVRHEGHFYSTKPPLLATIVAGVYWCGRTALGWNMHDWLNETTRLILLLVNVLPMTIALLLLSRMLRRHAASATGATFITACACLGTLLSPFVVSLNNHTPAAVAVIFTLAAALPIVAGDQRQGWRFAMAGFWSVFTFTCELPAAAFVVGVFALLVWREPRKSLLWFVPAALIPAVAFFYTNYLVTGGPMPFYAAYGSEKYEFIHEGIPSYWMQPRGLDKAPDSFPVYLLHCTVGHHGVLSLSPIFLLTLIGWCMSAKNLFGHVRRDGIAALRQPDLNWVHALGCALTAVVFAFFLSRTENYNYGGVSVALRWLLWLVPFWLLAMLPLAAGPLRLTSGGSSVSGIAGGALAAAALGVSIFSAWYPWQGPWQQPWLFTLMHNAGWIDYSDPRPQLERPTYSWISRLPQGPRLDDYWIEFTGVEVDGDHVSLRLSDGGPAGLNDELRIVDVVSQRTGWPDSEGRFWVHVAAFEAGEPPAGFLVWPDHEPTAEERAAAYHFWQGLPRAAGYTAAVERYLRLPLRVDAFHCIQAYSQTRVKSTDGPTFRYRRDAWLCDEVPFGVAQYETQVISPDGQIITRQMMSLSSMGTAGQP